MKLAPKRILDVSSPFALAYILSRRAKVIKTDIDPIEGRNISLSKNLSFRREDATSLSFPANSFDLVYSASVLEHIYGKYIGAVQEMIRVTKRGGYVYLAFSVAKKYKEEWLDFSIYAHQAKRLQTEENFFQYRFDRRHVKEMLANLKGVEIVRREIYWERKEGAYDRHFSLHAKRFGGKVIVLLKNSFIDTFLGFNLLENRPRGFSQARSFGDCYLILRKK